jgi:non-heme chloroperoxidase
VAAANVAVERRLLQGEEPLELLWCPETAEAPRTPLLFVHGAHVGAWCWEEHFLPWFASRGFPAYAVSLRGHGASGGRKQLNRFGLADYARDLAAAVAAIGRPPVLLGHSMGGMVAQKYLGIAAEGDCAAAVFACPVPSFGLLPATFSFAFTRPALFAGIQRMASGGSASPQVLAEAMFAGPMDQARLAGIHRRMQPESQRALMDMSGWGLPQLWTLQRVPMLCLGAGRDVLIPSAGVQASARMLGAEYRELRGLGHAVMLETRWEAAAQPILAWLEERGF